MFIYNKQFNDINVDVFGEFYKIQHLLYGTKNYHENFFKFNDDNIDLISHKIKQIGRSTSDIDTHRYIKNLLTGTGIFEKFRLKEAFNSSFIEEKYRNLIIPAERDNVIIQQMEIKRNSNLKSITLYRVSTIDEYCKIMDYEGQYHYGYLLLEHAISSFNFQAIEKIKQEKKSRIDTFEIVFSELAVIGLLFSIFLNQPMLIGLISIIGMLIYQFICYKYNKGIYGKSKFMYTLSNINKIFDKEMYGNILGLLELTIPELKNNDKKVTIDEKEDNVEYDNDNITNIKLININELKNNIYEKINTINIVENLSEIIITDQVNKILDIVDKISILKESNTDKDLVYHLQSIDDMLQIICDINNNNIENIDEILQEIYDSTETIYNILDDIYTKLMDNKKEEYKNKLKVIQIKNKEYIP